MLARKYGLVILAIVHLASSTMAQQQLTDYDRAQPDYVQSKGGLGKNHVGQASAAMTADEGTCFYKVDSTRLPFDECSYRPTAMASTSIPNIISSRAELVHSSDVGPVIRPSDWVEAMRPHSEAIAQSTSISQIGFIGNLAATRTSDNSCTGGCQGSIAYAGFANNDNIAIGRIQTSYAGYFEGTRRAGAGTTHGIEVNTANFGNTVPMSPVAIGATGITPGLWIAAGAGYRGTTNSSAAVGIIDNGAKFDKGIVFSSTALAPRADTKMEALSLANKQTISLYDVSGKVVGNIYSLGIGSATDSMNMVFNGSTMTIENSRGEPVFTVGQSHVTVTALQISPSKPASSHATCMPGQINADADFVYFCTAPDTWKRSALSGF